VNAEARYEKFRQLSDTRNQMPIELEPSSCRPAAGYVMVRCDPATGMAGQFYICYERAELTFSGEVVAVGNDVDQVKVGDRVLVESMSGHPCMTSPLLDEEGRTLAVVPCRRPALIQRRDEEHALKAARLKALEIIFGGKADRHVPPKAMAEIKELRKWTAWAKEARRGKSRSRLFRPIMDPASGQGVLAVIEEEA